MRKNIPVGISFNPDIYAMLKKMGKRQTRSSFVNDCVREKLLSTNKPEEPTQPGGAETAPAPAPAPTTEAPAVSEDHLLMPVKNASENAPDVVK